MDWDGVKRDWRIILLVVSLVVAFLLIFNVTDPYRTTENGDVVLNTNIKQGLDLQGGARVLIEPNPGDNVSTEEIQQTIRTLRTRISAFGLQEMKIRPVTVGGKTHVQIELAGADTSDLTELINRTGRFEATIPITVEDGTTFTLGDEEYTASVNQNAVGVNGETYTVNESFVLSSGPRQVNMTVTNLTAEQAVLSPLAFTGAEVLGVDISTQASRFQCTGDGCSFQFQVAISENAARRVQDIAKAFQKGVATQGGSYLVSPVNGENAKLTLHLDDEQINALNIKSTFQDTLVQQPVISGGADSREAALDEMQQLKSVLQSGALPVPIAVVQETRVSATLGERFLQSAILAIIVAILAVAGVVFLRYRDPRIVVPLTMTGFSELVLLFGFAAWVGWTIDLPSIAGIIAAIGTGVDDQIIITDERGKHTLQSFKKRFKRAFFIIFTSAASTIGAMLPLTRIGAGAITGFAVTTIAGVIIGVLITRPAYARVLQYLDA